MNVFNTCAIPLSRHSSARLRAFKLTSDFSERYLNYLGFYFTFFSAINTFGDMIFLISDADSKNDQNRQNRQKNLLPCLSYPAPFIPLPPYIRDARVQIH